MKLPIYLDNNSTTQVDERVLETMLPYFNINYGNPSSKEHSFGWTADEATHYARELIAQKINAAPEEIIFTSGTTESNNLILQGLAESFSPERNHIITTQVEHASILNILHELEKNGIDVTYLPVDKYGLVDPGDVLKATTKRTYLVSVMAANNEIGTIMPLEEIGTMCKERNIIFHSDAAQAIGRINFDVSLNKLDSISFSAHKIYGPKGIGALFVSKRIKNKVHPVTFGGGHEAGLRPGTLNVPAIAGFGKCIDLIDVEAETKKVKLLKDLLYKRIINELDGVHLNGHPEKRLINNLNLSLDGIKTELLLLELRDIAFSTVSACSSGNNQPSHVLKAIGLETELLKNSVRFGFGKFNSIEEIEYTASRFIECVRKIRKTQLSTTKTG